MGKASSAKKIARAARAGNTAGSKERRNFGFPAAVALLVVLGVSTVVIARVSRDAIASPRPLTDHWHAAYAVYDCTGDEILPVFTSEFDPDGIHSHSDGLIHIHPFGSAAAGENAQWKVFLNAMVVELTDDSMTTSDGVTLEEGAECDGGPADLRLLRWSSIADFENGVDPEVITQNLADTRFLEDREVFLLMFAPADAELPEFPAARIEALRNATGEEEPGGEPLAPVTDGQPIPIGPQEPVTVEPTTEETPAEETPAEETPTEEG